MSSFSYEDPYLFSDEFGKLPTAEFPVRKHFHVSKADNDRKLADAFSATIVAFSLAASISILTLAAMLGVSAVVAMERAEMIERRV